MGWQGLRKNSGDPGFKMFGINMNFKRYAASNAPLTIGFEVTTKCNSRCIMCVRREAHSIEDKNIDFSIIDKVAGEALLFQKRSLIFNLSGVGEPLLYEQLPETIDHLKQKVPHSRIFIITNGIALNSGLSGRLIQGGLDFICVSLNTGSKETYKWLCGVDRYDQVLDNILAFLTLRNRLNRTSPNLAITLKITDVTRNEITPALKWWKDRLSITDNIVTQEIFSLRDTLTAEMLDSQCRKPERYPCRQLWKDIRLDIDGNIYPCCGKALHPDYRAKSELCLGNIHKTSLYKAYAGKRIREIRRLHLKDRIEKLPTCLKCDAYKLS